MQYKNFTSLPPEQEKTFAVYERTSVEAGRKAVVVGSICGVVIAVLALVVYFAVPVSKSAHAVDAPSDLKEEVVKPKKKAKVQPAAAPAKAADKTDAEDPETPAETTAPPVPPKGATKAPPTALVK